MKSRIIGLAAAAMMVGVGAQGAFAQTIDQLQSSARVYTGTEWSGIFGWLCASGVPAAVRVAPSVNPADYPAQNLATPEAGTPPQADWYTEPQQIGENLYFLGTQHDNTYALVANTGEIILIDGSSLEFTELSIFEGLRKLGLDPANVRYQLISHAHSDHDGGVAYTQQTYPWITIVYGEHDWAAVEARTAPHAVRTGPDNDGVDGRVITVGDVSVKIYTAAGDTPETIAFTFDYRDLNGVTRHAVYGLGFAISETNPDPASYDQNLAGIRRMAQAAVNTGADVVLGNHSEYDNGYRNVMAMRNGEPDPFVIGQRRVLNYFAVAELCVMAAKLRAVGSL